MFKLINAFFILLLANNLFAINPYAGQKVFTYMHTDRYCYVSGDNVLVKVYHFNLQSNAKKTEFAMYIDIVNESEQFVCGQILKLENGMASGYIFVPDTLKTGEYYLRTYTQQSKKHNCILQTTPFFVTNRFGKNSESIKNLYAGFLSVNDKPVKPVNSPIAGLRILTSDSVFRTRAKIETEIELQNKNLTDTLFASYIVKPMSVCESYYSNNAKNIVTEYNKVDSLCSDTISLKSSFDESKGLVLTGKVSHAVTKNALDNILILLSYKDSLLRIKYAITDSNGFFKILIDEFYGNKTIYFTTYTYPDMKAYHDAEVVFNSKFISSATAAVNKKYKTNYLLSPDTLNVKKTTISKAYNINSTRQVAYTNSTITFENEYLPGKNLKTTNLDDYVILPNFYEIAKEILPFVRIRKKEGKYVFHIIDGINDVIRVNPLVIVDGVAVSNYDELMKWGSSKIKKVQVQIHPRYYGDVAFENGIVFIWTRKLDFWSTQTVKGTKAFVVQGFQNNLRFTFPEYDANNASKIPDFRSIQYWNPNLEVSNDIKKLNFYNSDETGSFEIILQGLTKSNKPVFIRQYFNVSK